jgi:hypothetical protein
MAVAIAVDMDAGAMAAEKMAARKPNPATNGLGSDGVDGLQRWGDVQKSSERHSDSHSDHLALDLCNSPWLAVGRRCSRCVNIDLQNRLTSIHVKTG